MHKITHIVDEQDLPESWILLSQGKSLSLEEFLEKAQYKP